VCSFSYYFGKTERIEKTMDKSNFKKGCSVSLIDGHIDSPEYSSLKARHFSKKPVPEITARKAIEAMQKSGKEFTESMINEAFNVYKSPVEVIVESMQVEVDNDICKAVQSYGIKVDSAELEKALNYDRKQYEQGFEDGCKVFAKQLLQKIFPYDVVDKKDYSINAYAVYRAIIDLAGDTE
jgi:hypothetical protein